MKCTKLNENAFKNIQLGVGVLLPDFDPETATIVTAQIIAATSGGVHFSAIPTYSDKGEGIDNCPKNMKELKKLDMWEIMMDGTFVTQTADTAAMTMGAADVAGNKITPRNDISAKDFKNLWWVGDYSDENGETNGGFIAIHMLNTLSTGGFDMQTTDKEKGQFKFTFTAHYSMEAQDTVPFEVFVKAGTPEAA